MDKQLCMSKDMKEHILNKLEQVNTEKVDKIMTDIEKVQECNNRKTKGNRKPSKYNIFIGECMRDIGKSVPAPQRMKTCAVNWKKNKK